MYSRSSHLPISLSLGQFDDAPRHEIPRNFTEKHEEQLYIPSFGVQFSPVKFSAQNHSTSELLRTLLMRGCF